MPYYGDEDQFKLEVYLSIKAELKEQMLTYDQRIKEIYDARRAKGMCKYIGDMKCEAQCGAGCGTKVIAEYREKGWLL